MYGDVEISDDAGVSKEESLSIKEIILRQIRKIGDLSCKEFIAGYWEKKPVKTGSGVMFTKIYHEDVREAYCNSVDFLIDIIYPMGDDDLQNYLDAFEGFVDKLKKDSKKPKKDDDTDGEEEEVEVKDDWVLERAIDSGIGTMETYGVKVYGVSSEPTDLQEPSLITEVKKAL